MNAKTFFSDRPIAYHPIVAKICGSVTAALFLSQIAYWNDKGFDPDGWIYKTQEQMQDETGMSRSEQETARRILREKGILKEERRGIPARLWYLIDWDVLTNLMDEYAQTRLQESRNQEGAKPAISTEITTKNTVVETAIFGDGNESTDNPTPAEKEIEQLIFGLGWKERKEIREMAEKDVGLVSLKQALSELRQKIMDGEYRANWGTLRKFWNTTLSTNVLRSGTVMPAEIPTYQRNVQWQT